MTVIGFYHSATVRRFQSTVTNAAQSTAEVTVHAALACRMSPLDARTQRAVFGNYEAARLMMEWGEETLQVGDLVDYNGQTYVYSPIRADVHRPTWSSVAPYQTGTLTLQKRPRRPPDSP